MTLHHRLGGRHVIHVLRSTIPSLKGRAIALVPQSVMRGLRVRVQQIPGMLPMPHPVAWHGWQRWDHRTALGAQKGARGARHR